MARYSLGAMPIPSRSNSSTVPSVARSSFGAGLFGLDLVF
jgi:hypothetical protein